MSDSEQDATDKVNRPLTNATALKPIDYEGSGLVVLSVDSSLKGGRTVLQHKDPNARKRYPA